MLTCTPLYNATWSESKEFDAPKRANAVLHHMESAYDFRNCKALADATTYNSWINREI
jgi:hypothetical protein